MAPDPVAFDVLLVGGGPAGLAAACAAAGGGRRVGVVDDNPTCGGQIWRGEADKPGTPAARWFARATAAGVQFLPGTRIIAGPSPGVLWAETAGGKLILSYSSLILAPGGRERFLPFPGWTLPNVLGAGGLQALVKTGLPIAGKRVVVAGSGPLLLAVAAYLHKQGAQIACIAEQAPWRRLARFGVGLLAHPDKLAQAIALRWRLRGVPFRTGCWPTAARGGERLEAITLTDGRRSWDEPCEYLACGFGLVPNVELPVLLGCGLRDSVVRVDDWQATTVPGVYCAGEATGIGGLDLAQLEGHIAGLAATGQHDAARRSFGRRERARRFARALDVAFALRDELRDLPRRDTIVCRCDDVTWGQLAAFATWRAAKLQTRCGMGPCQGRVCGPALAFLRGFTAESVRPPLFPARVDSLL
jgi:NADPH-dependent 2,4-dienoyl-CoA reductase/sulfur reductase-like enzyme